MNEVIHHCVTGLNSAGTVFCDYAGAILFQSAVLVVVLLVADLLLRKRVRAVLRYCVWLLVLVKLILPPTLALPTGIGYWLGDRLSAAFPLDTKSLEKPLLYGSISRDDRGRCYVGGWAAADSGGQRPIVLQLSVST